MIRLKKILMEIPKNTWSDVKPKKYSDNLIDLVQTAYKNAPEGSFVNTTSDLVRSNWLSIDIDSIPDLEATVFYRKPRSGEQWKGNKIQGIGHDGSREAINVVLDKLEQLLNKKGNWVEASDALEHILYKMNVPYVDDEETARKVFPNMNLNMVGDKGRYVRNLKDGSKNVKETIFGKPIV